MQLWFSLLALGSGSWFGVGLTKSRFKADYLPEKQTDFILAIVGEELGFVGILAVLILYTLWGYFALRIALKSRDRCGMLLGWALTAGVMLQAAINFGAMSGCFPTKGMPAPFISYGGSNLMGCLIATGILISIAAYSDNPGYRNFFRRKDDDELDGGF
jgi:cell division protein FtsW